MKRFQKHQGRLKLRSQDILRSTKTVARSIEAVHFSQDWNKLQYHPLVSTDIGSFHFTIFASFLSACVTRKTTAALSVLLPFYTPLALLLTHIHTCTQTQTCCIFITSDFDKVMSNSHLSEAVDSLATGGNWIRCDRVLSGLWELDIKARSPKTFSTPTALDSVCFPLDPRGFIRRTQGKLHTVIYRKCSILAQISSQKYEIRKLKRDNAQRVYFSWKHVESVLLFHNATTPSSYQHHLLFHLLV